jgi:recombinational DNA repair protein RecT
LARAANEGIQMLVATFDKRAHEFQTRLPSTISLESFRDAFITAVTGNKRLLDADTSSLFLALQKCADAGLKPDGQEAVITIFGDDREEGGRMVASNANKKKQAVFMPMVWGLVKLIKNAGGVKTVTAELVYKGEPCKIILGDEPRFEHERVLDLDYSNAPIIGAYAIVSYLDGAIEREWMNKYELDRVAAVNPSTKGPRSKWPDQMHRKGPLRRCRSDCGSRRSLNGSMPRSTRTTPRRSMAMSWRLRRCHRRVDCQRPRVLPNARNKELLNLLLRRILAIVRALVLTQTTRGTAPAAPATMRNLPHRS